MNTWQAPTAVLITAFGLVAAAAAHPRTRTFGPASTVLLDVLTAAGSVRPAGPLPWGSLLAAAAVIALCGIVGAGLHSVTGRVDHTTPNT
ncbi:hypothetical protein GCM10010347_19490 [Streptomyces cirratus]|uniref:Uncharacterized protein n=1 Tax=Streptomyces cirratus TaxID=68187 RepID=A0ABQ3ERG7_9ACTN|nr:hypothetical protein [Streptomyces cirratus]GHB50093.1 hypothetical protein GCM10010347_19490 [Streptomyces cirratus]